MTRRFRILLPIFVRGFRMFQFLGITLSNENFLKQHGESAFPLLASLLPSSSSPAELRTSAGGP